MCKSWHFWACMHLFTVLILFSTKVWGPDTISSPQRLQLRDKVLEMFQHAYSSYMDNAYPADELMPIACKGRVRGVTPSRGDVDDSMGNFSLTLVDTLDTLAVLGLYQDFEDAVQKVERVVNFESDFTVSVFETTIRMLGGLLGGHSAALEVKQSTTYMQKYNGSLLRLAKDLGDRLLPAFNTTSGMPMSRINLSNGAVRKTKDKDTCTACAGTMILEMAALSRFTGDPIYEEKARTAMDYLWSRRQRSSDLMGTVLNVESGEWVRKESGIGAGIDSYYEYLLKAYILLGDETFLERFNTHYQAIKQYVAQGPMLIDVLMHKPTTNARNFVDALSAFWPGLQVLKGDVKSAIETHELLHQVFTQHTFLPEAFTTTFDIHWGQYPLRPEFAESTYLLYKATGDPHYLEVGKSIVDNLEKRTRVKCGFAGIKDVRTFKHEDRMDSYFLAEMFKYLYLLFTPESENLGINIEDYVLTTEAHILPLKLSLTGNFCNSSKITSAKQPVNAEGNFERSCSNSLYVKYGNLGYIQEVRNTITLFAKNQRRSKASTCSNPQQSKPTWTGPRKLKASEFVPGNKQHTAILKRMGISMMVLNDGKVQLVQQQNDAVTLIEATEGALFMQEMIELSKSLSKEVPVNPLYVQLIGQPYLGSIALRAGPAQFGQKIDEITEFSGTVVISEPIDACKDIINSEEMDGKIVFAQRGNCMFINKAKTVEELGAIGIVIMDNADGTSFSESQSFAMAGDDVTSVNIPALFLFNKEGNILYNAVTEQLKDERTLEVMFTNKLKTLEQIILERHVNSRNNRGGSIPSDKDKDTEEENKNDPGNTEPVKDESSEQDISVEKQNSNVEQTDEQSINNLKEKDEL